MKKKRTIKKKKRSYKRKQKGGTKYTAIIIEPRKHKALSYVLKNFLENLDNSWSIIVFHGNLNKEYIQNIINNLPEYKDRISLISLDTDNFDKSGYVKLLGTKEFYTKIPTETFLIFQVDTMINPRNKENINKFLEYDYVGAPWAWGGVGNGGLSLRKKSKMLEILDKIPDDGTENGYYSGHKLKNTNGVIMNKPSDAEAQLFASETIWNPQSFGIHQAWTHTDVNKIKETFPEIQQLIDLQTIE
jgi:hypothetical protein